jgi:tetratricopeptide (TPR) repeat protein
VATPDAVLPPVPQIPPAVKPVAPRNADESIRRGNAGNAAYANQQYDLAITEYNAAIQAWDGNHLAWYGLLGARGMRRDFAGAAAAAERCVALVPDSATYWLFRGRMLYEAAVQDARTQEAARQNRPVDQVTIDASRLDFTPALQALLVALQLENKLWRAHYFIGRILRDRGEAKSAAEQFTRAIALHATDAAPYIALTELYRRWQYRDEAVAIAELGATVVPSSPDVWFEVGMVHGEQGNAGKAIDGFTRALDLQPDSATARFQRGEAYYRKKDVTHARADLEAFLELAKVDGGHGFEVEQARKMLADLER